MPIERERVTSSDWFPPWIRHEHLARYLFAAERAAGKVVVDCACGDGAAVRIMAPRAFQVQGFDLSEAAVKAAERATKADNVRFAVADATSLSVGDGTTDLCVSLETIEHLPDQESFLKEVVRILKPSGELICSTPDRDVYSPGNTLNSRPWNRFHIREYSQPEFLGLLSRYFDHIELFGQNPKSPRLVRLRIFAGRHTPRHLIVRLNQVLKLPRFLYDRLEHHLILPVQDGRRYEILIAVCSRPRRKTSG